MLTVCNVLQKEGEKGPFVLLELQGGLEMVQSQNTGRWYATVRKCKIPCTLEYEEAKAFIGKEIPGTILRVECDPYEFVVPETGEQIILTHRWDYVPEVKSSSGAPVVEMSVGRLTA